MASVNARVLAGSALDAQRRTARPPLCLYLERAQITKVWDKVVVDKQAELKKWAGEVEPIQKLKSPMIIVVNNHFAGCAPDTVRAFQKMLKLT